MGRYVVGVSGASGIVLAHKAIQVLLELGHDVDIVYSKAARYTALEEIGPEAARPEQFLESLGSLSERAILHHIQDFGATIASGSYRTDGMLLIPCSMATLAAVAQGLSDNLLRRAADVTLKERRPLVIVPRETPFSTIHLKNMLALSEAGAVLLPPVPAWYSHPKDLGEVEDSVVGRSLDLLGVDNCSYTRWQGVKTAVLS
jgi:4-hydroxy-3-polyprenylbenzoate decarboxylase